MKMKSSGDRRGRSGVWLGALALTGVLLGSWSVRGAVGERQVTAAEVAAAAAKIEARGGFPVLSHQSVVAALNQRVGTPEARAKTKAALERMKALRPGVDEALAARKLPRELDALPLTESGFDNDVRPNRPPAAQAAGIWQIVPSTARKLGLEVGPGRDDRLDPKRASAAAAAFLEELHRHYGDWPLAIAAYNGGRKLIDKTIAGLDKDQARRKLLESDFEPGRYLAGVMAAVILIENPALVD